MEIAHLAGWPVGGRDELGAEPTPQSPSIGEAIHGGAYQCRFDPVVRRTGLPEHAHGAIDDHGVPAELARVLHSPWQATAAGCRSRVSQQRPHRVGPQQPSPCQAQALVQLSVLVGQKWPFPRQGVRQNFQGQQED